jgi:hypothetical protein
MNEVMSQKEAKSKKQKAKSTSPSQIKKGQKTTEKK